jgi:dolichol-phosphate mannosyltransferase
MTGGSLAEKKALIIVPTYDEAENIGILLRRLMNELHVDVLVVDDNSPDGTQDVVVKNQKKFPDRIHLLRRKGKEGLAAAYFAGFEWALNHHYDYVVQMDADFSHDPRYVPAFLDALVDADVVVGSRYMQGGGTEGWSRLREFISRGGNTYAQKMLGVHYCDLTGGFNAWRRETLEKIDFKSVKSRGYAFQVELKYRVHCAGLKLVELPIRFGERKHGESKMSGRIVLEAALRVLELRRKPA